ncbi:MAG TPA: 4-(cytidine 5'-diphospho)-2-C-methyl-D-erythritol kinase [Symbiobacteriaceae bacterium]
MEQAYPGEMELRVPSYAKVNLVLDVLNRRPDGYHNIRTIMVAVSLADSVTLRPAAGIEVEMAPPIPGPVEANLAYRAACLLREVTGYPGGAFIRVEKQIPLAGGLAGGSTNAAAVLTGLNRLWGTGLSVSELEALAIRLGSDVPFFVTGRPARVEGIGDRITPIAVRAPFWLVLATPAVEKSTGTVYRWLDELQQVNHPDTMAMEEALARGDLAAIAAALGNVFEQVMIPRYPVIGELKQVLVDHGALGALMSGAGPTVFGVMPDESAARRAAAALTAMGCPAWAVFTVIPA